MEPDYATRQDAIDAVNDVDVDAGIKPVAAAEDAEDDAQELVLPTQSKRRRSRSRHSVNDIVVNAADVTGAGALPDVTTALPDEILSLIFSKVADGATLLDTLPLVCKRWCRVARDPASWAGVHLALDDTEEGTRLLLHAPAAASLEVLKLRLNRHFIEPHSGSPCGSRFPSPVPDESIWHRVFSSLRRSRVVVSNAVAIRVAPGGLCLRRQMDASIACFLARQTRLRELDLLLEPGGNKTAVLPALAKLRRLQKLCLTVDSDPDASSSYCISYDGQLAGAWTELRELSLNAPSPSHYTGEFDDSDFGDGLEYDECYRYRLPNGLFGDLVRGAPGLRRLCADMPIDADLEACLALRGLVNVEINVFKDEHGEYLERVGGAAMTRAVRRVCELLLKLYNPAMRSAVICVFLPEPKNYSRRRQDECDKVVNEFSAVMKNVSLELLFGDEGELWDSDDSDDEF